MDEKELVQILNGMESNSVGQKDKFIKDNQEAFKRFMGELYGNEQKHRSQYVSTDVADVIEADMPSLARVFLGAGEIIEFLPTNADDPDDIEEAKQKNKYIPWLIKNCKDTFKKQHDWLKAIEIYKVGVLEYGIRTSRFAKKKKWKGIDAIEMTQYLEDAKAEKNIKKVKIISQDSYKEKGREFFNLEVSLVGEKQEYFLNNVPVEDLILSRNVQTKDEADIVGKRWTKTRGELIEDGFDKETVKKLPKSKHTTGEQLKGDRYEGRTENSSSQQSAQNPELHWTMEEVSGIDVYAKVDYDEDGIRERRHIIKCGTEILLNEDFDHVPYSIPSAMLMPHNIIGRSRAEITMPSQWSKTVLTRALLDNSMMSTVGRNIISEKINADDLLDVRENGVVRFRGKDPIQNHVYPLMVPYVGDKTLQVIQYMDAKRAQTTGSLMANQGLEQDDLYKETATRFRGVEEASKAKVELVARVIAEVGYKDLYEGFAWFANHFQDDDTEFTVLGETLKVSPQKWKYEQSCEAQVGTGAGDDEQALQNNSSLLALQEQIKARGSVLVDELKIYNTVKRIAKLMGIKDITTVVNNPEVPQELLMAQVEQLTMMVAQYEQMQQNPLAEAEMVTAQKELALQAQKLQQEDKQFFAKLFQESQIKAAELRLKREQNEDRVAVDLTRIEADSRQDVPGSLID